MSSLLSFLFEVRNPTIGRAFVAAILAPPLAMVAYGLSMPIWLGKAKLAGGPITPDHFVGMAFITCVGGSAFPYIGMALVGLPAFFVLKGTQIGIGATYMFVGAASLPLLMIVKTSQFPPSLPHFLVTSAPGLLVAAVWWLLASR